MHGDYGNDTYYVDNAGDQVLESAGVDTGNDTIVSTIAFNTMVANVENYTFNTAAAVFFTGDAGDNVIKGGSGADTIDGAGGHDTLSGGAGNDQLFGGSLYDLLDGGKGADNMVGGGGDDVYSVDNIGDKVVETGAMNSGTDTVFSTISVDLLWDNVESLQLQGTGALHATGNNLDNSIGGNDGNNVINGGAGIDFLVGHKGNDTLTGGSGSDTFHFDIGAAGNEGHDTITDFVSAADVLSFTVGDVNNDKVVDINDLLVGMSVVDHGIGKAVDVHFADGGEITFAGVGTNTITHIEQLVADATTQIHVN
jgi:Ca2+-binding RTX toxin-like protein